MCTRLSGACWYAHAGSWVMQVSPWHRANASDVFFGRYQRSLNRLKDAKSIKWWDFNFEIIQPWYWSCFPCQDKPVETCKVLEQLGYIEQHSYVMSRHFTSWCICYVLQFFPFAFCDLCDGQLIHTLYHGKIQEWIGTDRLRRLAILTRFNIADNEENGEDAGNKELLNIEAFRDKTPRRCWLTNDVHLQNHDTKKVPGFLMWCCGAWCGFVTSAWQCRTWSECIASIGTKRSMSTRQRMQMGVSLEGNLPEKRGSLVR